MSNLLYFAQTLAVIVAILAYSVIAVGMMMYGAFDSKPKAVIGGLLMVAVFFAAWVTFLHAAL
jgi:hypothetical protein